MNNKYKPVDEALGKMKILITGGGGFLGKWMVKPLVEHGHSLRLMDVNPFDSPHEVFVGDVRNLGQVREAVQGMDALIIGHMAPRKPDSYKTPEIAFDINVKGTANLFFAAAEAGIRRVVLMSSTETIAKHPGPPWRHDQPHCAGNIYALTKVCEEVIAEQYSRMHGIAVAALRFGYLVETENMLDKYGRKVGERAALDSDPYDVGDAARVFLESDIAGYGTYPVMSTRDALEEWDLQYTCAKLDWEPRYAFDRLPRPKGEG